MEKDGYLVRRTDDNDRRKSIVELTDAGRALIARHADESNAIMTRLERRFGEKKVAELLDLLEDLRGSGPRE